MSSVVLWIDTQHAKIFRFLPGEVKHEEIKKGHSNHEVTHYFHDIAKKIADAVEILIVGPGIARKSFFHHLEEHNKNLVPKVVGVENMDHLTDGQIVAHAKNFFRKHDIFEAI